MARYPQSAFCIKRNSIRNMTWHMHDAFKLPGTAVVFDGYSRYAGSERLDKIKIVIICIQCDCIGCVDRISIPQLCFTTSRWYPIKIPVNFTRPVTAVRQVHVTSGIKCGIIGTGKTRPFRSCCIFTHIPIR